MDDKKLLEMAAKAAGIDAGWHCPADEIEYQADNLAKSEGMWLKGARSPDNSKYWNPLADDGDAFRLAVRLNIRLGQYPGMVTADFPFPDGENLRKTLVQDAAVITLEQASRRAIVRAAAEIGGKMP